ncbi:uncharacterized protein [Dendrobates tinctorius]|uniref:uncharacterized protein n=1 Tax=Dendrobates tinctorius TaxID=92724 RepID=UPI003CC937FA
MRSRDWKKKKMVKKKKKKKKRSSYSKGFKRKPQTQRQCAVMSSLDDSASLPLGQPVVSPLGSRQSSATRRSNSTRRSGSSRKESIGPSRQDEPVEKKRKERKSSHASPQPGSRTPQPAKRTEKAKHRECALCSQPLPDGHPKRLCQSCVEEALQEESSRKKEDIRAMIREELRALGGSSSLGGHSSMREICSPKGGVSLASRSPSDTGELDSDKSQEYLSSEDEDQTCFPTDSVSNLVKSVRNTMGLPESKDPKTPQDIMFAGISRKKIRAFPVVSAVKDLVKREWEKQGQRTFLPLTSKRKYPFDDEELTAWSSAPKVDAAVASTSRRSSLPVEDSGTLADSSDRKTDTFLKRSWEACTAAFKPAIAATCTARSMLVWLNDLEDNIKNGVARSRLLSSMPLIKGAAAFLSDSSADSLRLSARAAGLTNAGRRALWLKGWKGDTQTKTRLCAIPCQGKYLFGTELDEILTKAGERKKGFPNPYVPFNRRAYRKPPFGKKKDFRPQDRWGNKDPKQRGNLFGKRPFRGDRSR